MWLTGSPPNGDGTPAVLPDPGEQRAAASSRRAARRSRAGRARRPACRATSGTARPARRQRRPESCSPTARCRHTATTRSRSTSREHRSRASARTASHHAAASWIAPPAGQPLGLERASARTATTSPASETIADLQRAAAEVDRERELSGCAARAAGHAGAGNALLGVEQLRHHRADEPLGLDVQAAGHAAVDRRRLGGLILVLARVRDRGGEVGGEPLA